MIKQFVVYIDGESKGHLALVVNEHQDNTLDLFVFDYGKVVPNVNDKSAVFSFIKIDGETVPETAPEQI